MRPASLGSHGDPESSYKGRDGYKDICFPCNREFRQQFQHTVLDAYQQALTQLPRQEQSDPPAPEMKM